MCLHKATDPLRRVIVGIRDNVGSTWHTVSAPSKALILFVIIYKRSSRERGMKFNVRSQRIKLVSIMETPGFDSI